MKRKYVYLYLLGLLLFSVACTGNFRDYNTDLSGITDDDLIIDDNGYGSVWALFSRVFILIMISEKGRTGLSN